MGSPRKEVRDEQYVVEQLAKCSYSNGIALLQPMLVYSCDVCAFQNPNGVDELFGEDCTYSGDIENTCDMAPPRGYSYRGLQWEVLQRR